MDSDWVYAHIWGWAGWISRCRIRAAAILRDGWEGVFQKSQSLQPYQSRLSALMGREVVLHGWPVILPDQNGAPLMIAGPPAIQGWRTPSLC